MKSKNEVKETVDHGLLGSNNEKRLKSSPGLYQPKLTGNGKLGKFPVNFKFDLQIDGAGTICSIMKMVIDKMADLERGVAFESCEVKLFSLPPYLKEKSALLILNYDGKQIIAESNSSRWDNAFLNAFDMIMRKIVS